MNINEILLSAGIRSEEELKKMSDDDKRNTLIIELNKLTVQSIKSLQSMSDKELCDKMLIGIKFNEILLSSGVRSNAELKEMSNDDKRNTLIIELNKLTGRSIKTLQSMSDKELCDEMPVGIKFEEKSSFDKYVSHYLSREVKKGNEDTSVNELSSSEKIDYMSKKHKGKLRDWFISGYWVKVLIFSKQGLEHLLALHSKWTEPLIQKGTPRLLGFMVGQAKKIDFFKEGADGRMKARHLSFKEKPSNFYQDSGLVLCSLDPGEIKEINGKTVRPVKLYLHDGIGRSLPFLAALEEKQEEFKPIEAYCVFKP